MSRVGVHINSDYNTLIQEVQYIKNLGGNTIQLFVDAFTKSKSNYYTLKQYLKENNMLCVVHASYTINIARNWDVYSSHIQQFINEIELADLCGAFGIVIHMGKYLDLDINQALNNMFTSLLYVHNATKKYNKIRIFLETSTGQGTELCFKIEDLAKFFRKFSHHSNKEIKDRFRICLDTCHIFSAGYDLRTKKLVSLYLDTLEELIGCRYIGLVHLNDSKKEIGSNVDRHESLGEGMIKKDGLIEFSKFFIELGVPIILETPDEDKYKHEIKLIK
jgi:deoxyribonuclease-4